METTNAIFYIVILIMSVVIHEVAHGYAAFRFGDTTARDQGRLTLNPIKHLDLFGSVLLPALLILTNAGFVFGWAKPVPVDPRNFRKPRTAMLVTAAAGIASNFLIALVFGLGVRYFAAQGVGSSESLIAIMGSIVFVNLLLAIFNLVPIPPLDGSKILFSILGERARRFEYQIEQYSMVIFLLFIFFLWKYIAPVITVLFSLITGLGI